MHDKTSKTAWAISKSQRCREGCGSKIITLLSACKKICSIHKLILTIKQILQFHELKGLAHF